MKLNINQLFAVLIAAGFTTSGCEWIGDATVNELVNAAQSAVEANRAADEDELPGEDAPIENEDPSEEDSDDDALPIEPGEEPGDHEDAFEEDGGDDDQCIVDFEACLAALEEEEDDVCEEVDGGFESHEGEEEDPTRPDESVGDEAPVEPVEQDDEPIDDDELPEDETEGEEENDGGDPEEACFAMLEACEAGDEDVDSEGDDADEGSEGDSPHDEHCEEGRDDYNEDEAGDERWMECDSAYFECAELAPDDAGLAQCEEVLDACLNEDEGGVEDGAEASPGYDDED